MFIKNLKEIFSSFTPLAVLRGLKSETLIAYFSKRTNIVTRKSNKEKEML